MLWLCSHICANFNPSKDTLSSFDGNYTVIDGNVSFAITAFVVGYVACIFIDGILILLIENT